MSKISPRKKTFTRTKPDAPSKTKARPARPAMKKESDPEKKKKLQQERENNELLYGAHSISEALKAGKRKVVTVFTTKPHPNAWERILPLMPKKRDINIQYVQRSQITHLLGTPDHMGVAAWFSPFVYQKNFFDPKKHPRVLLLDGVQDVRNLGAILRTAHCTNFDAVILCEKNSAKLTPDAVKAAAGLNEHLNIFLATNSVQAANLAAGAGYQLVLTTPNGQSVLDVKLGKNQPICLVIGNEGQGVSKEVLAKGLQVSLPQKNADISYNASVAAGIFMFFLAFRS